MCDHCVMLTLIQDIHFYSIREISDHATFREKEDTLGWLDKLGFFLSLAHM